MVFYSFTEEEMQKIREALQLSKQLAEHHEGDKFPSLAQDFTLENRTYQSICLAEATMNSMRGG